MNLILTENRLLRFAALTAFYVAQGLPIGIATIALPAWLAGEGVAPVSVAGFIAVAGLPWGFKFVAGPIMDRFSFLPMGRRRPWIIFAQGVLVLAILSLSLVPDPATNVVLLSFVAFAVNGCAAFQDVAVDGMAIDILPIEERGRANSFMAFGQVAGYSGSGALSALLMSEFGLSVACVVLALGVGVIFALGILVRERRGERMLPWTEGEASSRSLDLQAENWLEIFTNLFKVILLPASLLLLAMTFFYRVADGFWITVAPLISVQQLGYSSAEYASWNGLAGFLAAGAGLALGFLVDRIGANRIMVPAMVATSLVYFATGLSVEFWGLGIVPLTVLLAQNFVTQATFIAFIALHMNVCWQKVSATQFAIYMAWANLSRSIGAWIYGQLSTVLEPGQEFLMMGASLLVACVLFSAVRWADHAERLARLDGREPAAASS